MHTNTATLPANIGRPKGGDPVKRRIILDAAITTFLQEGYQRAGVDTIAEKAGVAKQTVYNHFHDKERLFLAAIDHERASAAARLAESVPPGNTVDGEDHRRELIALAEQVLEVLLDERAAALQRLIISEIAHHPALRPVYVESEPRQLVGHLTETLLRHTERGALDVPEPRTAARLFVSLLIQQGLHGSTYGTRRLGPEQIHTICRQTVELFLRAYERG